MDTDMTDVEMSSLTPPSNKVTNLRAHVTDQADELADDSMTNIEARSNSASFKTTPSQHIRRKRSVLSRKGKRLAHLQSRELIPTSRGLPPNEGDDLGEDSYGTEESDDEDEDEDEEEDGQQKTVSRRKGTPSRIRSITKYAVNYILPNSVAPIPHQPTASSPSGVHYMDKPELLLCYAQLVFNASILSAFLYLLFSIFRTVQRDVAEKVRAYEMGECRNVSIVTLYAKPADNDLLAHSLLI